MANTLFAFVGKKIAVTPIPSCEDCLDAAFEAKYQVLQKVYGDYQGDTITFTVYDHYGTPSFERYEHALLFVSKGSKGWYHEKYQYFDVYLTASGRWAGRYNPYDYSNTSNPDAIKPIPIAFPSEAVFPLSVKTWEEGEVEYLFPQPFYKVERDTAFPLYGNYVEDLFEMKKRSVLGARGLFDHMKPSTIEVIETRMAEIRELVKKKDKRFIRFWEKMARIMMAGDTGQVKAVMLDSLLVGEKPMAATDFLARCYPSLVDGKLKAHLTDTMAFTLAWAPMDKKQQPNYISQSVIKDKGKYKAWQVIIGYDEKYRKRRRCEIKFIETKKGFKLFSWGEAYSNRCCQ